ncbi:VOC family protein [Falsihalocynthiibacter arcticus]|uniref:Glyoxalase-like domain-containing protein n=1 Tax=Falsihalocynthiibacter arcticus TaxID=1579316 RepID=A0A126UV87_9RHOB|nr:VOC family protein [Falsihalocynthiibacter arcticus]AML49991.1 hypothetical protein RC74_00685 [Falsihalocynthiibacter arcticus]
MPLEIDHFAIACETLSQGVEYVQDTLGIALLGQGQHPKMGTHNRLLSLGPNIYLEVISVDPNAPRPPHPRWFDLDSFSGNPRVTNWICRTNDLKAAIANSPENVGQPMAFERGKYRWDMAVPADGKLPYDGCFPALIQWHGNAHPASELADVNCRFLYATIQHPNTTELSSSLEPLQPPKGIRFVQGDIPAFAISIETPTGERTLK